MQKIFHRAVDRGVAEHGWLKSRYSFSFADWFRPDRLGFGALRVLNDDRIAPNSGFPMHPHANMEIVTVVTSGAVTHEDSLGNRAVIPAGDVQIMSAGTGVVHAEFNRSADEPLELFQIWITPHTKGLAPSYAQAPFRGGVGENDLRLLVSPTGEDSSLSIRQEAFIWVGSFDENTEVTYRVRRTGNGVYLFIVSGGATVDGETLEVRDAVGVWETDRINFSTEAGTTVLVFDVPLTATG